MKEKEVIIRNNRSCLIILHPEIRLSPGINSISYKQYLEAKEHYGFQMFIDVGYIVVKEYDAEETETDSETSKDKVVSLKALDSKKAVKAINAEDDPSVLQKWLLEEERVSVKSAIERRIDILVPNNL